MNSISVLLEIAKFAGFWLKNGRTQGVCHVINIFFGSSSDRKNCVKIHYCRMCVTNFMEGWPLPTPPHP